MNQWNLKKICNTQKNGKPRKLFEKLYLGQWNGKKIKLTIWQINLELYQNFCTYNVKNCCLMDSEEPKLKTEATHCMLRYLSTKKWKIPLQRAVWNTKFLKFMNKIEKPPAKVFLKDSCINLTFRNFTVKTKNCQAKITLWKLHSGQRNDKIIKPKILQ